MTSRYWTSEETLTGEMRKRAPGPIRPHGKLLNPSRTDHIAAEPAMSTPLQRAAQRVTADS